MNKITAIRQQFLKDNGVENQDSYLVQPLSDGRYAFAVADGLGGAPNGAFFSHNLMRVLRYKSREIDEVLMRYTSNVNRHTIGHIQVFFKSIVCDFVERVGNRYGFDLLGGTTLAVAWQVTGERFVTYSVGDSEIMVSSALTQSPWIVHDLDLVSPGSNQLTNAVTMCFQSSTQVPKIISLKDGDVLALYTDGLGDNLHPNVIQNIVRSKSPKVYLDYYMNLLSLGELPFGLQGLQATMLGRPKPDDLTLIARCF